MKKMLIWSSIISFLLLGAGLATTIYGAIWIKKVDNVGPIIALIIGAIFLSILLLGIVIKFYLKFSYKSQSKEEVKSLLSGDLDTKTAIFCLLNPLQASKLGYK